MQNQTSTIIHLFAARNLKLQQAQHQTSIGSNNHPRLYALPLQVKQLEQAALQKKSTIYLVTALVLLLHVGLAYFLVTQSTIEKVEVVSSKPMLVSLIAPPAPEPELVPVIEPPKPEVKPIVKPKKVVEKIRPIETPTERLVEATTDPIVVEETPVAAEPVQVSEAPKAPPKAEKAPEEKVEPPRFGVSYLNNPAPEYPSMSRRLNEEGRVLMKVLVSAQGNAEDAKIEKSSGSDRLDNAAIKAVMGWQFIPAKKNNQPLSAYVLVPMKFSLSD